MTSGTYRLWRARPVAWGASRLFRAVTIRVVASGEGVVAWGEGVVAWGEGVVAWGRERMVAGGWERCQADGMSFFESIPQPPPPEPARRRRAVWQRPDAVIPGSVPAELVLARTEQAAVAIGSIRAYPNGFEFTLHARLRREDRNGLGRGDPLEWHGTGRETHLPEDLLRLGVMYADGRRAATTGGHPWPPDESGAEHLIMLPGGGGGNERTWDGDIWVYPPPTEGPVTFVASWLKYGVAETRAELDSAVIRAAARRAVILWPEDPEFEPGSAWASHTITASSSDDPGTESGPD